MARSRSASWVATPAVSDPATQRFRYTVNEQVGVLPKGGDPYQIQFGLRIEP